MMLDLSTRFYCRFFHRVISSPSCEVDDFPVLQWHWNLHAECMERSCGSGVGGVERNAARYSASPNLHISLTFSRLSGTDPA